MIEVPGSARLPAEVDTEAVRALNRYLTGEKQLAVEWDGHRQFPRLVGRFGSMELATIDVEHIIGPSSFRHVRQDERSRAVRRP
jgi:hypothetical protein